MKQASHIEKAYFSAGFLLSFIFVHLYTLALIESKYSIFLQLQPFRMSRPLTLPEEVLFALIFSLELYALLLAVSYVLWALYLRISTNRKTYISLMIPILVVFACFVLVTAQFQVLRFFKDGIDHLLISQLGGGNIWSAISFAADELAQLLPVIIAVALTIGAILLLLVKYGSRALEHLSRARWVMSIARPRNIVIINLVLFLGAFIVSYQFPVLNKSLGYSLVHGAYEHPWKYLTDIDFDGYGMVPRPVDQAPFDADRHPYALEVIANGIDENGVGGDLTELVWHKTPQQWNTKALNRKNVLLLVLESARSNLVEVTYEGQRVMPVLHDLPGKKLNMFAHAAFSAPSIIAIFNGVHSRSEPGVSLLERFNNLGYRTGVFSGQNEGFGGQDKATGMQTADVFYDSRSAPPEKRMHLSSSAIASAIPHQEVLSQAIDWLSEEDSRPFFAYINLQELHFPYSYRNSERLLIDKPIPRYAIQKQQSDWLKATYYNSARAIDQGIGNLVESLKISDLFKDTVILVVGDHGEELFDSGSLGHGTSINLEQNSTVGKIINSPWTPLKSTPVGLSEVPTLLHNALAKKEEDLLPLRGTVLSFLGVRKSPQIGLFSRDGLVKYDFKKDSWTYQSSFGSIEETAPTNNHLIHTWESYVLSLSPGNG
ncbi:MAG: sulfatase-like hydrolase/transferase [Gammaproteobacteria bacterium]|nr:sulfatase-like hydrolase/transferase [Gammaproteobacteria bacterium]